MLFGAYASKIKNAATRLPSGSLHLFILFNLAIAQPLYDLLGRSAPFFVAERSEPVDILLLVFLLSILIPLFFLVLEIIASLLSQKLRLGIHALLVALLLATISQTILKPVADAPGVILALGAGLIGIVGATAYFRFDLFRQFLTFASIGVLVIPAAFLLDSDISKLVFPYERSRSIEVEVTSTTPVVMVVFDELPVTSLMDEKRHIDSSRYHNFARLAKDAHWFRKATTVADMTHLAFPAILNGRVPRERLLPTIQEYPNNLFTLLGNSYGMRVYESHTRLCPEELCREGAQTAALADRMLSMLVDVVLMYLHIVLPDEMTNRLPPVDLAWHDFIEPTGRMDQQSSDENLGEPRDADLSRVVSRFVDSIENSDDPQLYFIHIKLPHVPWRYLPNGKRYLPNDKSIIRRDGPMDGLNEAEGVTAIWYRDDWLIAQGFQRHLLQLGFADKLLGEVLGGLQTAGLYERSLVIVVGDHGASFRAGEFRRQLSDANLPDILPVPVIVKLPYQDRGVISDRNVQVVDIMPTIAEVLDVTIPWSVDGRSLLDTSVPDRTELTIFDRVGGRMLIIPPVGEEMYQMLDLKIGTFGSGARLDGLYRIGRYSQVIGQEPGAFPVDQASDVRFWLDGGLLWETVDPESEFVPARITGQLDVGTDRRENLDLAIAINGTIQAVTRTFANGQVMSFSAMVPERSFRKGYNRIELYLVSGPTDRPRLQATTNVQTEVNHYSISNSDGRETIETPEGNTIPIVPGAVGGNVERGIRESDVVTIVGWSADLRSSQPAESVLVVANGEVIHIARPNLDRPDVAAHFGKDDLVRSGFRLTLPLGSVGDPASSEVRVIALSSYGVASELDYGEEYAWGKRAGDRHPTVVIQPDSEANSDYDLSLDGGNQSIVSKSGEIFPIVTDVVAGTVDHWSIDGGFAYINGWAVDIRTSREVREVLLFSGGRFVASRETNFARPDVARAVGDDSLITSGFDFVVPMETLGSGNEVDARVSAVSKDGVAQELAYSTGYPWVRNTGDSSE